MSIAVAPRRKRRDEPFPLADLLACAEAGQYIRISDVSWDDCQRLLEWRDEHRLGAVSYAEIGRVFHKWVRSQIAKKSK